MSGKSQVINMSRIIMGFHVKMLVGHQLGSVHQYGATVFMSHSGQQMHVVDMTGNIGSTANGQQFGAGVIAL